MKILDIDQIEKIKENASTIKLNSSDYVSQIKNLVKEIENNEIIQNVLLNEKIGDEIDSKLKSINKNIIKYEDLFINDENSVINKILLFCEEQKRINAEIGDK